MEAFFSGNGWPSPRVISKNESPATPNFFLTTADESARTNRKKSRRMLASASIRPVVSTMTSETDPTSVPRKVNLRALPDSRRAGLGQNDPQGDAAFEPALAVARPHDGGDQHGDHDEHERAGDFIDAPEFEALFQPLVPVITA